MNELEKDLLQILLNNDPLLTAIRKVFYLTVEKEKPLIGESSNDLLGEKYRAYELTKQIIEKGFIDLMSYKVEKSKIKSFNKAR